MPRLTMLLPHYPPDVAADGQLFSLLARELVKSGVKVRVLTWRPRYQGAQTYAPGRETVDGVEVSRWWAPHTGKSLPGRAFAAWWVSCTGFWRALFSRGSLLIPSSPPTLGLVGWWLSWLGRRYLYVLHDIHPDLGIALGRMKPGLVASVLRFVQRRNLARGLTVAITEGMAGKARELCPKAHVTVIENWVDTQAIQPRAKADSAFAREHGLSDRFTLQYSGNLGLLHPLGGLTRAMKLLPDVTLCYIGRGARLDETKAEADGRENVRFFDYQPLEKLSDSLAACDVAVVALEPGADRLAMPSKLTGILAAGRPVLVLAPESSELAQLVQQHGCGVVVSDFDNPQAVTAAIGKLRQDASACAAMAQKARGLAEDRFSLERATGLYRGLLP